MRRRGASDQRGFTLVELLVVILLGSTLLALGVGALRNYWFVRSLVGGQDELVTQLRSMQEKAVAESHPVVYGAWFDESDGSSDIADWGTVRFCPDDDVAGDLECTDLDGGAGDVAVPECIVGSSDFDTGVYVSDLSGFTTTLAGESTADMESECRTGDAASADRFVFFLARGVSTSGEIELTSPRLGRSRTVDVVGLTGRVRKLD